MDSVQVGILAIGNEVVEGQITNRNAAWLSEQLERSGYSPTFHVSCRDDDDDIQQSLDFLSKKCRLIIVSGGLGPTKDDFTRQSLSRFLKKTLMLDSARWNKIEAKLLSRGLVIREGHKNQALFPEDSQVLENEKGIAPGFFAKTADTYIASLPGPPNELHWMYTNQLLPIMRSHLSSERSKKLYTWICLGAPESDVAHVVESLIGSQFDVGFRLHKPYVEVKVWAPEELDIATTRLFKTLSDKLSPWFVANTISSIRQNVFDSFSNYSKIFVVDQISTGLFLEKLKEGPYPSHLRYQCFENSELVTFREEQVRSIIAKMTVDPTQLVVGLFPSGETSALCCLGKDIHEIGLPRKIPVSSPLGQAYVIEHCFLKIIGARHFLRV